MIAQRYVRAISAGGATQILTVVLGFLALWLTTLVLDKQAFGELMIGFSIVSILSLLLAAGPQGLVLYHVSRAEPAEESSEVVGACLRLVLLVGLCVSAALWLGADAVAKLIGTPELSDWLPLLVPFVVTDALLRVLASWEQGRQHVVRTALFRDVVPLAVRCGLLAVLLFLPLAPTVVAASAAAAYVGGAATALGLLVVLQSGQAWRRGRRLAAWDWKYIAKLTLNGVATKPQRSIDILLVGAFASTTATADYAVASRLANVLLTAKQVVALLLVPRFGWLLARGDRAQLFREFDACRGLVLLVALAGAIAFMLAGPFVLSLFGDQDDYATAFQVLLVLSVAMLVRGAFGNSGQLLNQAGMAGWTLTSSVVASGVLILAMVAAVPAYGAMGGAVAVAFSGLVSNFLIAWVLRARAGLSTISATVVLSLVVASGVLLLTAGGLIGLLPGTVGLGLCWAGLLAIYADQVRQALRRLRGRQRPATP